MAQLLGISFKRETLETILKTMKAKEAKGDANGGKYFDMTVAVNDDAPRFGQNVSAWVSQTKEQRDAGADKFFVANGKTFWAGNGEFIPEKYDKDAPAATTTGAAAPQAGTAEDDLPF